MKRFLLDRLGDAWSLVGKAAVLSVVCAGRFLSWLVGEGSHEKRMAELEQRIAGMKQVSRKPTPPAGGEGE